MTATLAPRIERDLEIAFGAKLMVLREDTVRRNLKYFVSIVANEKEADDEIIES